MWHWQPAPAFCWAFCSLAFLSLQLLMCMNHEINKNMLWIMAFVREMWPNRSISTAATNEYFHYQFICWLFSRVVWSIKCQKRLKTMLKMSCFVTATVQTPKIFNLQPSIVITETETNAWRCLLEKKKWHKQWIYYQNNNNLFHCAFNHVGKNRHAVVVAVMKWFFGDNTQRWLYMDYVDM